MVQLVQGGIGVATLPRRAVERLLTFPDLRMLACDARLQPLPIHASYRTDPTTFAVETLMQSAFSFVGAEKGARSKVRTSSKKSMT